MKKVLYISFDGLTDPLGQSQILPYLENLSDIGHQITILSLEKEHNFRLSNQLVREKIKDRLIEWEFLFYKSSIPILSQFLNYSRLSRKARNLFFLNRNSKFEIVHARSYLSGLIALQLKNKFKSNFLFDMRGFWVDERIEGGIWRLSNPVHKILYNYFKSKEKILIENADAIVTLSQKAKLFLKNNFSIKNESKVVVIPCAVDLNLFCPTAKSLEAKKKLRSSLSISSEKFIVSYLGSLGTWYMFEEMIDFVKKLNEVIPCHFLIISNDDKVELIEKAKKRNLDPDNFSILKLGRPEIPTYLSISDLSIFFIKPSFSKIASSPTKMGEILALGIPILANDGVGDVAEIIKELNCGFLVSKFETKEYDSVISQLKISIQEKQLNCRAGAEKYFSLDSATDKYNEIYEGL